MMIPRLETERLVLREWRASDFDTFVTIMADAEGARYLPGGHPMSRMDTWRFVTGSIGVWVMRGYGTWVVERKSDSAVMGRIGLIHPDGWPGLEIGWTLGREFWGHGYATEAALASRDYAFLTQPVAEIVSTIHPDNAASQRVAARIGETIGPRMDLEVGGGTIYTCDVWRMSREAWKIRTS